MSEWRGHPPPPHIPPFGVAGQGLGDRNWGNLIGNQTEDGVRMPAVLPTVGRTDHRPGFLWETCGLL